MDSATVAALDAINCEFYEAVAPEFSASRNRINPGISEGFEGLEGVESVLDAGCGDGRVGLAWVAGDLPLPWSTGCRYVGLERSRALLAARAPWPSALEAVEGDLLAGSWPEGPFDVVCCFATLHHLPGRAARRQVLRRIGEALSPGGTWVVSVWQFLHLDRYRKRIADWAEVRLDPGRLEPGDLLLDWRRGPRALRYVHHYEPSELIEDCEAAGLALDRQWSADEGLGLYVRGRSGV
jgi:SAM-dependent methyltransferase